MFIFSVKGVALTASFRLPETHTFHQTLPLPPKTTIVGMIGAAMGLGLADAHDYADKNNIHVGVVGKHRGMMKDLWNYRKITGKEKNYTEGDIKNRKHFSVLIREYLFDCEITLFFGSGKRVAVEDLREAFKSPFYALTIGNSDDLFKVQKISEVFEESAKEWKHFENTILPGECSAAYRPDIDLKAMPVTESINAPQVYLLPTKFTFNGEERRVAERKPFTFIGSPVELTSSVKAYVVNSIGVVLH
jgi:CRISPR-associated protein Cas5t